MRQALNWRMVSSPPAILRVFTIPVPFPQCSDNYRFLQFIFPYI
jgi:hypothetical protein